MSANAQGTRTRSYAGPAAPVASELEPPPLPVTPSPDDVASASSARLTTGIAVVSRASLGVEFGTVATRVACSKKGFNALFEDDALAATSGRVLLL